MEGLCQPDLLPKGRRVYKTPNQRYESWRMPYGESCSMPHAHAATRIHTVDLVHSSLGISRLPGWRTAKLTVMGGTQPNLPTLLLG